MLRRALLAVAAGTLAFGGLMTQAVSDRGPPVEITSKVHPEELSITMSGKVIASKPCRRGRDLSINNKRLNGGGHPQGTFRSTGRRGHFHGEVEFLYQGEGNSGDVPESGGTITFTLKAPRTRPQKGRFSSYNCPRIVHTERVDIPPDPGAGF
jgi:hypothetical protein